MASTRAQQAQLITNATFLQQLAGALIAAGANVLNEAASTANHANRVLYANAIFQNPALQAAIMAPGILTNATIAGEAGNAIGTSGTPVPDADIDFVVASLFNAYANQYAAQHTIGAALQLGS